MNVMLQLVPTEEHDKFNAIAAVTNDRGRNAGAGVHVAFLVGGRSKAVRTTGPDGTAAFELKLAVGQHLVTARLVGGEMDEVDQVVTAPAARDLGPTDWLLMLGFWICFLVFGPGTWVFSLVGMLVVFAMVYLITRLRGRSIAEGFLCENNWVFFGILGLAAVTAFFGWLNPLLPRSAGGRLWDFLTSSSHDVGRHMVWRFFNKLFFGRGLTRGWSQAAFAYATWWAFWAGTVSFRDNVVEMVKAWKKKKGGGLVELVTHAKYEVFFELVGQALKGIFKGAKGK